MGTSSSSAGPGPGVPFNPPWLDEIPNPALPGIEPNPENQPPLPPKPNDNDLSPNGRFRGARANLNQYVSSGDTGKLGRALGHYSQSGMGGSKSTAQRMRTSSKTAANIYGFLQAASSGASPNVRTWVESLTTRNADARQIADEIVNLVAPKGGSLDENSAQNSISLAFEDLLIEDPDVDLLHLDEGSIWSLAGSFLGYELFNRVYLDIGQYSGPFCLDRKSKILV